MSRPESAAHQAAFPGTILRGLAPMSAPRLLSLAVLLVAACAAWETSSPSYTAPPVESPTPSHYAPPPPVDPQAPSSQPEAPLPVAVKVAIASVQLLEDCPDPAPTPAASASAEAPARMSQAKRAPGAGDVAQRRRCSQSTVQLSVRSDAAGQLRIEGVRVLDANSKRIVGPAQLRGPTRWSEADGIYTPWDERTVAGTELRISYKLGDPDMSRAAELVGPEFNTYVGPFLLELDVSIDGHRQTIRSPEFTREPVHVMVT